MSKRKKMTYEEYKAQERARLEEEDRELARREEELKASKSAEASSQQENSEENQSRQLQYEIYEESEQDVGDDNPTDSENEESKKLGDDSEKKSDSVKDEEGLDEKDEKDAKEKEKSEEDKEDSDEKDSNEDEENADEKDKEDSDDKKDSEEEDSEKDKDESDKDKQGKDSPEKVDSESRKNLGPNRGQNNIDDNDNKKNKPNKMDNNLDNNSANKEKGGSIDSLKNKAAGKLLEKAGANENVAKAHRLATNAVAAVKGLVSGATSIGKLLVNPVFWVVIAAIIILAVVISMASVIGGNDYNQACDSSGIGSVSVADDADDFTRQAAIASWLMNTPFEVTGGQPMNKEQASAVVGNFMQESYMANPKAMTGDSELTQWQTCGNDCVASWGGKGKAIGLAQWMGGRRLGLVDFAKSEGTEWHDLTTQLKYLKKELDSGEGDNLKKSGFGDPNKTLEDYTWLWQDKFERAGESRTSNTYLKREQYAQQFYSQFTGSGVSGGSLTTQCVGGGGAGSVDASNLVQLALDISYTREEKAARLGYGSCSSLVNCGQNFSKPEYVTAKKMAEEQTGTDPMPGLIASCDRMAATLYRLTGLDVNYPWGDTRTQISYMNDKSNGWTPVSCQERQPGDAIARPGHIMVYIGMVDGRDTIASASIGTRSAHLSDLTCKGDSWYADGGTAQGWRKTN